MLYVVLVPFGLSFGHISFPVSAVARASAVAVARAVAVRSGIRGRRLPPGQSGAVARARHRRESTWLTPAKCPKMHSNRIRSCELLALKEADLCPAHRPIRAHTTPCEHTNVAAGAGRGRNGSLIIEFPEL